MRDDVLPALLSEAGSFGSRVHEWWLDRLANLHIYKVSHSNMFMCSTYQTSFDFIFIQPKGCCRNTWYVKLHPFKTRFKQFGLHWSALLRFNARQRHSWFLTKALVKSQVAERGSKNPIRNSGEKTSKPWIYPVKPPKIHIQSIQKCCQREAPNPHGDQVVVLDWKMACDDFWLLVVMKWEECKQLLALERHKVCRFSSHWLSFSFHPFLRNLMRFENFLSSWNLMNLEHFVLIWPFLIYFFRTFVCCDSNPKDCSVRPHGGTQSNGVAQRCELLGAASWQILLIQVV